MQDQPAERSTPLPLRHDTILGVCEALGQEFGFNPLWLRVAFAAAFIASPTAVVGTYLALGIAVAVARLLFPNRAAAAGRSELESSQPRSEAESREEEQLPMAA